MKAPLMRKYLKPTGKWVSDADLRHDAAIRLGCPTLDGQPPTVPVNILTSDLREKQKHIGGQLVVDANLIVDLYSAWIMHELTSGERPDTILHIDYPDSLFAVRIYASRRTMSHKPLIENIKQASVPGPVRFVCFYRVPKSF